MNMELLHNIYEKSLFENERNITFWENYLQNLEELDLNVLSANLTLPVLVPIGTRMLFRGKLVHTNEITVALGADYFAKCSVNQAEILKQHRIKDAKSKLELLKKERDYLQSQLSFSKQSADVDAGYDIIEVVTQEEDENWRKQHRENVRQYKQRKDKGDEVPDSEISNEDLWNRLEELELQEELENELTNYESEIHTLEEPPSNITVDDDENTRSDDMERPHSEGDDQHLVNEEHPANSVTKMEFFQQPSKLHVYEQVVEKQKARNEILTRIKSNGNRSETERDLEEKLDNMEKLEEIEDEIVILEDMLVSNYIENTEVPKEEENVDNQQKKSVVFADEDDSETFELSFQHSEVEPTRDPYDPQKGITKPSDIYIAYSNFFNSETTSILKKTKCDAPPATSNTIPVKIEEEEHYKVKQNSNPTIVIKDVVEKNDSDDNTVKQNMRPMSLFKKRRQQLKE